MSLVDAAIAGVIALIFGGIALVAVVIAYELFERVRTGFLSVTPVADVTDGVQKVRGTVVADQPLPPAVADEPTVMSLITVSRQEGLSGKAMGSWEEHQELLRAVSFEVRDESGSLPVEHVDEPHQSGYRGVTRDAVVQLEGGADVPAAIDEAFTGSETDLDAVIETLEESSEEADEAETEDASDVLADVSPLKTGTPQKFEERYVAPGDEVYVVGGVTDGRLTNESSTFQVLHGPRSRFDLAKGVAGGVALLGIGLLFGYGTFNYLSQVARELGALL